MKRTLLVTYALLALLSIALLVWIIPANVEEGGWGLSPALLPDLFACVMLASSFIEFFITLRADDASPSPLHVRELLRFVLLTVIFLCTFPLMHVIGFWGGGFICLIILQVMCGQKDPRMLLGISAVLSGAVWAAMKYIVQVPMP